MHTLTCHPDTPAKAISAVRVMVARDTSGNLLLRYGISGDPQRLAPSPSNPPTHQRRDELWQHSCFEAFLKPDGGEAYLEFNFAPTEDWQAYALSGYREGRHPAENIAAPAFERRTQSNHFEMHIHVQLAHLPLVAKAWKLGLSAVIEETGGTISYWALQHAPAKPDFHHPDAFALTVTP